MGNLFSIFISATVDYGSAALSAMLWEHIFLPYDPKKSKFISVIEGLLQLSATIVSTGWISSVITPAGTTNTMGMVLVMFFGMMLQPNMIAKLNAGYLSSKNILGFNVPSILFGSETTTTQQQ